MNISIICIECLARASATPDELRAQGWKLMAGRSVCRLCIANAPRVERLSASIEDDGESQLEKVREEAARRDGKRLLAWMLRGAGASYAAIAAFLDVSDGRAEQLSKSSWTISHRVKVIRERAQHPHAPAWVQRLAAANAFPSEPHPTFDGIMLPPDTWPATPPKKKRKR